MAVVEEVSGGVRTVVGWWKRCLEKWPIVANGCRRWAKTFYFKIVYNIVTTLGKFHQKFMIKFIQDKFINFIINSSIDSSIN